MRNQIACIAAVVLFTCALGCKEEKKSPGPANGNGSGTPAAPAVDQSSPRSVALAFAKAVKSGDLNAAHALSVGSPSNDAALQAMSDAWQSVDKLIAAIRATDPQGADNEIRGMAGAFGISLDLDADAARAVETITGNTAIISDPEPPTQPPAASSTGDKSADRTPPPEGDPVILKRVDGKWKVDLNATLGSRGLNSPSGIAQWRGMAQAADAQAAKVRSGEVKPSHRPSSGPSIRR